MAKLNRRGVLKQWTAGGIAAATLPVVNGGAVLANEPEQSRTEETGELLDQLYEAMRSAETSKSQVEVSSVAINPLKNCNIANDYDHWIYDWQNNNSGSFRKVNVMIDKTFSNEQKTLIKKVWSYMISRPFAPNKCVDKHASTFARDRSLPFPYSLPYTLPDSLSINMGIYYSTYVPRNGNSPLARRQTVFINRYSKPQNSDGSWELGTGPINYYDSFQHCSINLNAAALGPASSYFKSEDRVHWAGVVLHEMMHNFGWTHGSFGDADYGKAWMVAYERCYTGDISLPLTGPGTWRCGTT